MADSVVELKGWRTTPFIHVWPERDKVEHNLAGPCICGAKPEVVDEPDPYFRVVHKALDGRQI